MAPRGRLLRAAALLAPVALLACVDRPPDPLPGLVVFRGGFRTGVTPWAFSDSKLDALSVDGYAQYDGASTIRIDVPASSWTPGFAGGPFLAAEPVDLSRYSALTFLARAARPATLDKVGFGNDFTTDMRFQSTLFGLPLTTEWTAHRIPILDPARMPPQAGLFWYGASSPTPYSIGFADVRFLEVPAADLDLQPSLALTTLTTAVGRKVTVPAAVSYADVDGTRRWLDSTDAGAGPPPAFLRFDSSDWTVASVDWTGTITAIAPGQALISARLGATDFPEPLAVNVVTSLPAAPTAGPADPTYAATAVISLYGGRYAPAPGVNTCASWSSATCSTVTLGGNAALKYAGLHYAGVDFSAAGSRIDVSRMRYLHADVWTPDATKLGVKLVSFPAAGGSVEATVAFTGRTRPPILPSTWISLDIPLSAFANVPLDTIGQLLWLDNAAVGPAVDEGGTFFIDNVYFHP
jgi:hypothetical protein